MPPLRTSKIIKIVFSLLSRHFLMGLLKKFKKPFVPKLTPRCSNNINNNSIVSLIPINTLDYQPLIGANKMWYKAIEQQQAA